MMFANTTMPEYLTLIAAISTAIVAIVNAIKTQQVHSEVKTLNAKTIGVLAGETETRRIEAKPVETRTYDEVQHLHDVPPVPPVPAEDIHAPTM